MKKKIYKLFSDCFPVKGHSRSIIYDLTRKSYDFIPNSLYEIIKDRVIDLKYCYEKIDDSSKVIFDEYINFLLFKEYIFEISNILESDDYPELNLDFHYPSLISNGVIDFKDNYKLLDKTINQLTKVGCNFLIIRFLKDLTLDELEDILKKFDETIIFSIDILIDYNLEFEENKITELILKFPRINIITIFKSPFDKYNGTILNNGMGHIIFTKKEYKKNEILKNKDESNFAINIKTFTESLNYNNFFNKKIYISENGLVKNSPFANEIYGDVNNTLLIEIINSVDFTKLWNVTKDSTQICKDCEFRYMCIDNRNLIKHDVNSWSHEDSCNYDPYSNLWK